MKLKIYLLMIVLISCFGIIACYHIFSHIREPVYAGIYYPQDSVILKNLLNQYIDRANADYITNIKSLISPHGAYDYCGEVAAYGYKSLNGNYNKVIILAPSHYIDFEGVSISNVKYYKTPLGLIKVDPSVNYLKKEELFTNIQDVHKIEHAIEIQLPFLQEILKEFTLIPLVLGKVDPAKLANILIDYIDKNTLIIVSSDLSHDYDYDSAVKKDKKCIDALSTLDFELIKECEACGIIPLLTIMEIAKQKKWNGKLLDYKNSGDIKGSKNKVVGFMSFAFYEPQLNKTQQDYLLKLARQTIEEYILEDKVIEPKTEDKNLLEQKSAYITLKKGGEVIGCMGRVIPFEPLYLSVRDNALEIAKNNPSFYPLKKSDLSDIKIEISVLTPYHKINFRTLSDLLNKIHEGEDGLMINEEFNKTTLLPKLWYKYKSKKEFLVALCNKAGLSKNCWDEDITFYKYKTQEFEENPSKIDL
ncbi:MAG: AmmeMemoRadiSam system protein B [Nanoarchaeota archaeon]|nr:AmmeMemoRadiSam system protein B [Nanoarchaeota archaeon]